MDNDQENDTLSFAAPAQAGQPDDQDDAGDKAETLMTKEWVAARFSEMFTVGAAGPRASKQQESVAFATNKLLVLAWAFNHCQPEIIVSVENHIASSRL